jgi:hypothetical protein
MLTDILDIWTPDNGDQYALVQDLAAFADDVENAILNPPYIRLTSTFDASPVSTQHAFQIGSSTGQRLIMDNFEIASFNGGVGGLLALNNDGGTVRIGNSSSEIQISGHLSGSNMAWTMAAGTFTFPDIAAGATTTRTITFPSGKFSVAPRVQVTNRSTLPLYRSSGTSNISATSFDVSYSNSGGTTVTAPSIDWFAVQMNSGSASG